MNSYALIDLHCDTLTDCIHKNSDPDTLDDPGKGISESERTDAGRGGTQSVMPRRAESGSSRTCWVKRRPKSRRN